MRGKIWRYFLFPATRPLGPNTHATYAICAASHRKSLSAKRARSAFASKPSQERNTRSRVTPGLTGHRLATLEHCCGIWSAGDDDRHVAFFARDVSVCVDPELVRDQTVEEYFMSLPDGQPEPEPVPVPERAYEPPFCSLCLQEPYGIGANLLRLAE